MKPCWFATCAFFCLFFQPTSASDLPQLSLSNRPPELLISWPTLNTDWVLEQSTNLGGPTGWMTLSPALYQTGTTGRSAPMATSESFAVFRLRRLEPGVSTLTGYWPFDETITSPSPDFSPVGTPMELVGVTGAPGRIGRSGIHFNGGSIGIGSYASVSNTNYRVLPAQADPFSVSLWFNIEASAAGGRGIVGMSGGGSNGWHVRLETPAAGPSSLVFAGADMETSLSITGKTLLLPNQWHQLTIAHDGRQGFLYLDSALLAHGDVNAVNTAGRIYFGGGFSNLDSFLGTIDEVRTFAHCLSEEEISVAGHWRFNDNGGGLAFDRSIHGRHAGITELSAWTQGREGSAIDLACGGIIIRNDDFAVLPPSGGAFSVSMWLRPNAISVGAHDLMSCGNATNGWQLSVNTDADGFGSVAFCSTNRGGTLALLTPLTLTNGVWTKLDVTYNGGVATLYANGRALGSASGAIRGTRAPLVVGSAPGTLPLDAIIDELKIYSRELSASELGPVAKTMWETVLVGTETNIVLQGFGPKGKPLTYNIVPLLTPTNGSLVYTQGSKVISYRAGTRKGPDAFTYTVTDGEFTSPPTIVTLSVVQPHWLSPSGGSLPADGSDPAHAWAVSGAAALDAVWRTNAYYDCFFYGPGLYETKGFKWLERYSANPGCKHIGSGSTGPAQTTLKLVDVLQDRGEGTIFAGTDDGSDGFEVHRMLLDCNAANLPRSIRGEPVWMRIPLATTSVVQSVTLRWSNQTPNGVWQLGSASAYNVCARRFGSNTACITVSSTNNVDVVVIDAEADELLIDLQQRAADIDLYSLAEVEVTGGTVSLPSAKLSNGDPSQLNAASSILWIADQIAATTWTSGSEDEVEIVLPLARGTLLNHLEFHWNCKAVSDTNRLGAAAEFRIRARDEQTGVLNDIPFVRHGRASSGRETVSFGTADGTNNIITDQVVLILTAKELGVGYYSLRDVWFRNGSGVVPIRVPTARTTLQWGAVYSFVHAFDRDPATAWASGGPGMTGAVALHGNNLKFTDLKVIGFGTHPANECFPMFISPPIHTGRQYIEGNVLIEDCVFTQPAPKNKDGLTTVLMLAFTPSVLTNAVARRCSVLNVRSEFTYSHGISASAVEHCRVENCDVAVYFEPGSAPTVHGSISIRSNAFINVNSGIYWLFYPGAQFDTIICQDNDIVLNGNPGSGIAACDTCAPGPSGFIKSLTALNNVIRYADWILRPAAPNVGILYSDISHSVVGNNVVALGTGHELRIRQYPSGIIPPPEPVQDCDYLPPPAGGGVSYPASLDSLPMGYQRAWFNNRSLSGNLLDVRFSNYGSDGRASQQQWPE